MRNKITIGHLPILDHLILGIAKEKDTFKHFSLDAELFSNWDDIANALTNKKIDGAFLLFPLALDVFRKTKDIQLVLLGHREGQVLAANKDIKGIRNLRGKKVFVPHIFSTHHILLHKLLQTEGLTTRDVTLQVGNKNIKDIVGALAGNDIQAFIAAEPFGTESRRSKAGHILSLSHDVQSHHIDCVLVLRKELVNKQPGVCQELVESLVRAGMFINAYPRQAAEMGEGFLGWSKKTLIEGLTHDKGHILFWDLLPRLQDFETLQNTAVDEMGLWKDKIDLEAFVYPHFAQTAYREWMIDVRREVKDRGEERTLPGSFQEAVQRFLKFFPTTPATSIAGLTFTRPGEKYPKDIRKLKEVKEPFSVFLEKVFDGQEFLVRSMSKGKKSFSFLRPAHNTLPDRVLCELSIDTAQRCLQALQFGEKIKVFADFHDDSAEVDLVSPKKEIIMLQKGDVVWCSLGYTTFRFLVLLLVQGNFSGE